MKRRVLYLIFISFGLLFYSNSVDAQVVHRGFGYSSIVHIRHSGPETVNGFGTDSYELLFGEDTLSDTISLHGFLYEYLEIKGAYISANGDINGDGMDDLILVFRDGFDVSGDSLFDNSIMIVFDGNDGKEMFRIYGHAPGWGCYLIEIGDYDGDGKDEIAHARHSGLDVNGDGFGDNTYIQIFDEDGSQIWGYSPFDGLDSFGAYIMKSGDFNGDNKDDLLSVHHWGSDINNDNIKDNSYMFVFDIHNNSTMYTFHPFDNNSGGRGCYMISIGDYNGDRKDEIAHARHSGLDVNGDGFGDNTYIQIFDEYGDSIWGYSPFEGLDSFGAYIMKSGDFNGDNKDDLLSVHHWGSDINNDTIKDNSYMFVFDIFNAPLFTYHPFDNNSGGRGCYMISIGDYDGDGKDEIAHARHSGLDVNGDGFGDNTYIQIFDEYGDSIWGYSPFEGLDSFGAYIMESVDFNGDNKDDLLSVHHWGSDINNDIIKDNSYMFVFDVNDNSIIFEKEGHHDGGGCYMIEILNNEITDKELLSSMDLNQLPSIIQYYYENRQYHLAMDELFTYYKDEKDYPQYLASEEYYDSASIDNFINNIKSYSTALAWEDTSCFFGYYTNNYPLSPSSGHERMGRIFRTLLYRKDHPPGLEFEDFSMGIKSVLSHIRWASDDNHYMAFNNHGLLFELSNYIPAIVTLNEFYEFEYTHPSSWQKIAETRLSEQLNYTFSDGINNEYAFNYSFWVSRGFYEIYKFCNFNTNLINFKYDGILNTVDSMYVYFLYAIKPVIPDHFVTYPEIPVSDLPIIGDSYGKLNNILTGKIENKQEDCSILNYPLFFNWDINNILKYNLKFVLGKDNSTPPAEVSKLFEDGGIFISRSNWINSANELDTDARYCHFKARSFIKDSGHNMTNGHAHADLLSVDIAAYNKNIVVDPGGYLRVPDVDLLNIDFNYDYFTYLYGYTPYHSTDFDKIRHYFKGTAAHNTVYINHTDQAMYISNWVWDSLSIYNLVNHPIDCYIENEFDYISAGYTQNANSRPTHNREMLYVKPNISDTIKNDYWIFSDILSFNPLGGDFGGRSISPNNVTAQRTEQIWHISPEQNSIQFNDTTGIVKGDNFWIIPLLDSNTISDTIPGYYLPNPTYLNNLYESVILKYILNKGINENFAYLTIIFPFDPNIPLNSINITKINVFDRNDNILDPAIAQAFLLEIEINGSEYKDYCMLSHSRGSLYWDKNGDSIVEETDLRMEFYRYNLNDSLIKSLSLPWLDHPDCNSIEESTDNPQYIFALLQNYPNPFFPSTSICYTIPENSNVQLNIYNILGQRVKTLVNGEQTPGAYSVIWDSTNDHGQKIASGVYFYRINVEGENNTYNDLRKMLLLK